MCVTLGFACGLNPAPIPASYLAGREACQAWADAAGNRTGKGPDKRWSFFNEGTKECRRSEWPYYVALYRNGDFGFFEVLDLLLNPDVKFEDFVTGVLSRNKGTDFKRDGANTYVKFTGERIDFALSHDSRILNAPGQPNMAIFASGTYMNTEAPGKHHIVNPATGQSILLDDSNVMRPMRIERGR